MLRFVIGAATLHQSRHLAVFFAFALVVNTIAPTPNGRHSCFLAGPEANSSSILFPVVAVVTQDGWQA